MIRVTDFYKCHVYHRYVHVSQSVGQVDIFQNEASLIGKHMFKVLQTQINNEILVR